MARLVLPKIRISVVGTLALAVPWTTPVGLVFCGRDGVKKYDIAEIEPERRNGYAWYGTWGKKVAEDHARWIKGRKQGNIP